MEYETPEINDDAKELLKKLDNLGGQGIQQIQDMNKFLVALELFKLGRLPLITDLDKEHVQILTRHDTLIESAKILFKLKDDAPILNLVRKMDNSYMMYQISRTRKSRTEIVKILQNEAIEAIRNTGDRILGKR